MICEIMQTTSNGQVRVGTLSTHGGKVVADPATSKILQAIISETAVHVKGETYTAQSVPIAWLRYLPVALSGSYIRARLLSLQVKESMIEIGGPGSGDYGHVDVKGRRGGSAPSTGKAPKIKKPTKIDADRAAIPKQWRSNAYRMKMIEKTLDEATDAEKKNGMNWYEDAHAAAQALADKYHTTLPKACAVIAAFSPRLAWEYNIEAADEFFQHPEGVPLTLKDGRNVMGLRLRNGYVIMQTSLAKAQSFLDTDDQSKWFSEKDAPKTYNFFHNILEPDNPNYVTIDRHAIALSVNKPSLTPEELHGMLYNLDDYNTLKETYLKVAAERGFKVPNDLQAITWTHWSATHAKSVDRELLKMRSVAESGSQPVLQELRYVSDMLDATQPYTGDPDAADFFKLSEAGTSSSGDYDHAGRPGERGGSAPSSRPGERGGSAPSSYEPEYDGVTDDARKAAFGKLASSQRGKPEAAMLKIQELGGGVLSFVVEHTGDLTHRMSEHGAYAGGKDYVGNKVDKVLRTLENPYGFAKEMEENIANNAVYRGISADELHAQTTAALDDYTKEHQALEVYNRPQWLARQAAIELGQQHWSRAISTLHALKRIADLPTEEYTRAVQAYDPNYDTSLHEAGTASSGDHAHAGRPGERGGSAPSVEPSGHKYPQTEAEKNLYLRLKKYSDEYLPSDFMEKGRFYDVQSLPKEYPQMELHMCYGNAAQVVMKLGAGKDTPGGRYVEGYAWDTVDDGGHATAHAWVGTDDGKAIDPTWEESVIPLQDRAYFGVEMNTKDLMRSCMRSHNYGPWIIIPGTSRL